MGVKLACKAAYWLSLAISLNPFGTYAGMSKFDRLFVATVGSRSIAVPICEKDAELYGDGAVVSVIPDRREMDVRWRGGQGLVG